MQWELLKAKLLASATKMVAEKTTASIDAHCAVLEQVVTDYRETFDELETFKHQYFEMEKHYRETKGIPENETLGQVAEKLDNIANSLQGLYELKLTRG